MECIGFRCRLVSALFKQHKCVWSKFWIFTGVYFERKNWALVHFCERTGWTCPGKPQRDELNYDIVLQTQDSTFRPWRLRPRTLPLTEAPHNTNSLRDYTGKLHILHGQAFAKKVNPYSTGIDFRRQNLTSKVDPRTERVKIFLMAVDP